jgi:hypothetical protein
MSAYLAVDEVVGEVSNLPLCILTCYTMRKRTQ